MLSAGKTDDDEDIEDGSVVSGCDGRSLEGLLAEQKGLEVRPPRNMIVRGQGVAADKGTQGWSCTWKSLTTTQLRQTRQRARCDVSIYINGRQEMRWIAASDFTSANHIITPYERYPRCSCFLEKSDDSR